MWCSRGAGRSADRGGLMSLKLGLHIQTLAGLVGAGTVICCSSASRDLLRVRQDPYVDLRPHLGRLRAWSKA